MKPARFFVPSRRSEVDVALFSGQHLAKTIVFGYRFLPYPSHALFAERDTQLAEKGRREGSEKVYDERMDMIMEVRMCACALCV